MANILSAFPWIGGKGYLVRDVIALLPPHHTYVEPFGGAMSVLLNKRPAPVEVYNDINADLVNFFRILKDEATVEPLIRRLHLTPYSRQEFVDACAVMLRPVDDCDPVERAAAWYVTVAQAFSGRPRSGWGFNRTRSARGMALCCAGWLSHMERLPAIHARIAQVQIEQASWEQVIDRYDDERTCFYCDPPYLHETRRMTKIYDHEMTMEDHERLLDLLLTLRGMAIVSGYDHPLYRRLDAAGWYRTERDVSCSAAGRTRYTGILGDQATYRTDQRRVECLWVSPGAVAMHRLAPSML